MWKCKNPECGRTFPLVARISSENRSIGRLPYSEIRVIVDKPCCPFCESIEFEEITEKKDVPP